MRLRHPDGQTVHLACAFTASGKAQPSRLLKDTCPQATAQRDRLGVDILGISLHLNQAVTAALAASAGMRRRLRSELAARGLETVTVHVIDTSATTWQAWLTHLLDLARVLVDLMPDDSPHGTVSAAMPTATGGPGESEAASRLVADLGAGLTEIAWNTGRLVRAALEPAPGALISGADDAVRLLASTDPARVGVCLNPGRLAAARQAPARELARLRRAHIGVTKLRLDETAGDLTTRPVAATLLTVLLGGAHPECDHLETATGDPLDVTRHELGMLALDGPFEPPGMRWAA